MKIIEKLAVWFLWAFGIVYGIPALIARFPNLSIFLIIVGLYLAVGIIVEVVSFFIPEKKPFYF